MGIIQAIFNKNQDETNFQIGDVYGLWDIARNKVIGLTTLSIYYRQAESLELKLLLKSGADLLINSQISNIQKLLTEKGFDVPTNPNWKDKFDEDSTFEIPRHVIDDAEIVMTMREGFRLTLNLEAVALRNATNLDVRKLINKIVEEDNFSYAALLHFQRTKGWDDFPPMLLPQ